MLKRHNDQPMTTAWKMWKKNKQMGIVKINIKTTSAYQNTYHENILKWIRILTPTLKSYIW